MNRLRILKGRIKRSNDTFCAKTSNGYAAVTMRDQGHCVMGLSKRQALFIASRWAMPDVFRITITQSGVETTTIRRSNGLITTKIRNVDHKESK